MDKKGFVCSVCGYTAINGSAPDKCPVCMAPKKAFVEKADALKTDQTKAEKGESEKKHIPAVTVVKKCGLIPGGCVDVHVKVGEIMHPMEEKHYITFIDIYLDNEFISRIHLTPKGVNPAGGWHLKVSSGKISAVEHCNVHGSWIKEVSL